MPADRPPHEGQELDRITVEEQLEEIREALDDGDVDEALHLAEALALVHPDLGEVQLELAATRYEAGSVRGTLEAAERAGQLGVEDEPLRRWYIAASHHYLWEFDRAREILTELLREDDTFGEAWYLLAQICEVEGDEVGARRGYESAAAVDPERFARPTRLDDAAMRLAVHSATDDLPPRFREVLDTLAVVVQDLPTPDLARSEGESEEPIPPDVLGLFVGNDRLDQSVFNPVEYPGVIFLFQRNLERVCPDGEILAEEIRTTLWHELAHYLGFEEEDMPGLGLE